MESIEEMLKKEPKKAVRIPKAKDEKGLNYVLVAVNGHSFQVMRGVEVKVPKTVYSLLEKAGYLDA